MIRIAAITMAFNEPEFLPLWVEHYGRLVGFHNLYVVSLADRRQRSDRTRRYQLIDLPDVGFDEATRAETMSRFQAMLLLSYDWVVMSDSDELIVPDPDRYAGLKDFVKKNRRQPFFNTVGFNVVQDRERESRLGLTRPLFHQRDWVRFDAGYCKPLLARIPLKWGPGFHFCDRPRRQTDDLYLFHLRAADETIARTRVARLNAIKMSKRDLDAGNSRHFQFGADQYVQLLFPRAESFPAKGGDLDPMPDVEHLRANPHDYNYLGAVSRIPSRFRDSIVLAPPRTETGPRGWRRFTGLFRRPTASR